MSSLAQIHSAFNRARDEDRAALMPYFTLGYPDYATSLDVVQAVAGAGADLIELGVPFSDPLADGPTIQHSTQVAIEQGISVPRCLEAVATLRDRGVRCPLLLMGYVNPILAYGQKRFVSQAISAGADGFIVPDLPPEEAEEMEGAARAHEGALVYLLTPTATPERMRLVAERTSGFLYLVSLTGVTGARSQLAPDLSSFVERVRSVSRTPVAVGFGISTPEQVHLVGSLADGVIVGSALIRTVDDGEDPAESAWDFVRALLEGTRRGDGQ